ncbi:glycosyltransferase family 2 protein [Bosea sp. (in: a-proteobacteria)]|uniref:glycosyltransferase family 2 protein n=1 Tax=Bosea sp. (in: a-proteobacteria) TaxID=1871050 RepID=UPI00261E1D57|nr:glycosyltransferase family 2 protein [Bosea sp. (in: a-proteobacteria)]MCO5093014.1 glycosyltransferase family 2 protein [Bosea sp. (in: a-proteobacteria)]
MTETPSARPFAIIVGIATSGRREVLRDTLARIDRQERRPDRILICPAAEGDVDWDHAAGLSVPVERVDGPKGLTAQRNAILDAAGEPDLIVFFDDDYLPADRFLAEAERLFRDDPGIVAATGALLADGIRGPGIDLPAALAILENDRPPTQGSALPIDDLYGCNMVFRFATIRRAGLRFDENLPLYGWHEDIDFSGQLRGRGRIVLASALRGVHRGTKRGRTSGLRFGYSQIANPIYVTRKGTVRWSRTVRFLVGNVGANLLGSLRPPGLIDRRGRLKGNLLALWDLVRGRLAPQRVLTLG